MKAGLLVGEVLGSPGLSGAHMFSSQNLRQKDALKQFRNRPAISFWPLFNRRANPPEGVG